MVVGAWAVGMRCTMLCMLCTDRARFRFVDTNHAMVCMLCADRAYISILKLTMSCCCIGSWPVNQLADRPHLADTDCMSTAPQGTGTCQQRHFRAPPKASALSNEASVQCLDTRPWTSRRTLCQSLGKLHVADDPCAGTA